ncbi:unnamed protein product [Notodromas monacha]|uniref:Uncharacterized protein n=1 Tax=Notodromas monacha TaxID=399045 RepID=A0A7R9BLP9_9CRUS|nr:unnamed protein product [Notodromas monacha]CAG0916721.1 unnamed protein product [Notodromas monacha]
MSYGALPPFGELERKIRSFIHDDEWKKDHIVDVEIERKRESGGDCCLCGSDTNVFRDLTPEEQQLLLDIRRRKAELLKDIQFCTVMQFRSFAMGVDTVASPSDDLWKRGLSLAQLRLGVAQRSAGVETESKQEGNEELIHFEIGTV